VWSALISAGLTPKSLNDINQPNKT